MSHYKLKEKNYDNLDKNIKIAFVTAEFNHNFTSELEAINKAFLQNHWFENIDSYLVPWVFEIPGLVNKLLTNKKVDLIIALWVVIKWDTPHFDYVCAESARGIMELSIKNDTPIMNGILTCFNEEQVQQRIKPVYALSGLNTLVEYNSI